MTGTIRTLDSAMQDEVHLRVWRTAEKVAKSYGVSAVLEIERGYPVTVNDPSLTAEMLPLLNSAGEAVQMKPILGAEHFSFFARQIPGLMFGLGVAAGGASPEQSTPNHSPYFTVNDRALPVGIRALSSLALAWLHAHSSE